MLCYGFKRAPHKYTDTERRREWRLGGWDSLTSFFSFPHLFAWEEFSGVGFKVERLVSLGKRGQGVRSVWISGEEEFLQSWV